MMKFPLSMAKIDEIRNTPVYDEKGELAEWPESGRVCGECMACCHVLGISELGKSMYADCRAMIKDDNPLTVGLTGTTGLACGCAMYGDRPSECRKYQCLWRCGMVEGDERRRPDKLGLLMDFGGGPDVGVSFLVAWEVWPGASDAPSARWFLDALVERCIVVLRRYGGKTGQIGGPPGLVRELFRNFERRGIDLTRMGLPPDILGAFMAG